MDIPNAKLNTQVPPDTVTSVRINRDIRSSGLLAFLSPEELQTMMAVLTFVDASGKCELSARALGQSLNLSEKQAQKRLKKLCRITWCGRPLLIREDRRDAGRFQPKGYRLPEVAGVRMLHGSMAQVGMQNGGSLGDHGSKSGGEEPDAGILPRRVDGAGMRKRTFRSGTPGTDVEGIAPVNTPTTGNSCVVADYINKKHTTDYGYRNAEGTPVENRKQMLKRLLRCGVSGSTASELLDKYPAERIARQLEILPFRNAKEPAAMLVKAIKEDWTAPAAYMGKQKRNAELKAKAERESAEAERRERWQERVEAAKSKLSRSELQEITRMAREKVRSALSGALRGDPPERLVNVEVNRIIAGKYASHEKK